MSQMELLALLSKLQKMHDSLSELEHASMTNFGEMPSKFSVLSTHYMNLERDVTESLAFIELLPAVKPSPELLPLLAKIYFRTKWIPEFEAQRNEILRKNGYVTPGSDSSTPGDSTSAVPEYLAGPRDQFQRILERCSDRIYNFDSNILELVETAESFNATMLDTDRAAARVAVRLPMDDLKPASLDTLIRRQFV